MEGISILFLSIVIGASAMLNMIGAQSFLLSKLDAVYLVYSSIVAGLLSTFFFRYLSNPKIKFANFSIVVLGVFSLLLLFLSLGIIPDYAQAITWCVFAGFGVGLFRWIIVELIQRHLDPARAQSYFSYLSSFFGIGVK